MNSNLAQLIELSGLDSNIDAYVPKIEDAKAKSTQLAANIAALEKKELALAASAKEALASRVQTENSISELTEKLTQIKEKSALVVKEKDIQALTVEEDIAQEQLNKANNDIERFEKAAEQIALERAQNAEEKAALEEKLAEANKELEGVLAALEKERAAIYVQKEELAKTIDTKLLSFYEKIRKWAKNTAVVKVENQACYGCFMKLNNKSFAAVRDGDEISTCPHCGRIVYYKPSVASTEK